MAINTATNFSVGANLPIDERLVVANLEALNTLLVYEGLVSYVVSEKCEYIYQDGVWKKYEKENKAHISATAPNPAQTDVWLDTSGNSEVSMQQEEPVTLLNGEESLLLDDTENVIINEEGKLLQGE